MKIIHIMMVAYPLKDDLFSLQTTLSPFHLLKNKKEKEI